MRRVLAMGAVLLLAAGGLVAAGVFRTEDPGYQVRAIFDSAFSVIEGEDVKVAGVKVGKIAELEVTPDNRAAVVLEITEPGFQDFRADAQCTIRPQSLIGEKFVECTPTEPRPAGAPAAPPLRRIDRGPGEGQYLLPVERTSRPVDVDLLNNITRLPERQRLAIILNELGAGLAARGEDLNETIRRANPALKETNRVIETVARQNQVLRKLAVDSDRVLAPLARDRRRVTSFVTESGQVARANADRRAQLEQVFARLPRFIAELRPTMLRLGQFSDQFQPVLAELEAGAPQINRMVRELGPFSQAGIPSLRTLGEATEVGRPALVRSKPIIDDLRRLAREGRRPAADLRRLTESFRDTGGIERAMDFLYYLVGATNGYDSLGHYLRAGLVVTGCEEYSVEPTAGCSSTFSSGGAQGASARSASARGPVPPRLAPTAQAAAGDAAPPADAAARDTARPADPAAEEQAQEDMLEYLLGDGS